MMTRRVVNGLLVMVLLALQPGISLGAQDAGTGSALDLGTGARAIALGRAGVTESRSAFTGNWNPGALGAIPRVGLALQHASLFGGALHESLGFVYPTLDWGTASLTLTRVDLGGIEGRDQNNLPDGEFRFVEQQAALGYGYPVWGPFYLGAALKVHNLSLDGLSGTGVGADAGLLFQQTLDTPWLKQISAGLACRNAISPVIKLQNEGDRLFPDWRLGAEGAFELIPDIPDQLLVRLEAQKPERADFRWHAGLEYQMYDAIALRGGWDHEYFSAGAGFAYAGVTLDYAVSFPTLGLRHLVTLSMEFGKDMGARRADRATEEERRRQQIVHDLKSKIIEDYKKDAKAFMQKSAFAEAAKLWEKVLDWEPENTEAQAQLALAKSEIARQENARDIKSAQNYMRKKQYIDVMVECQKILERSPDNAIAQSLYTQAEKKATRLGTGSLTTNVKTLQKIRKEYQLGLQAYTKRNYAEAVKHWEAVIETTPLQKQVYRYLQTARERIERAQKSKTRKVVKQTKRKKMYKEAVELSRNGKLKDAVRSWEKLAKENPEDKDAQQNLEKTRKNLIDSQKKGIRW